jgi:CheY-like chemotaxis protein
MTADVSGGGTLVQAKILLAEDSKDSRMLVTTFLEGTGYRLDYANDGLEAVEKFKRNTYGLILMDIQMPTMDGLDATKAIRDIEMEGGKSRTTILAFTANTLTEEIEKCIQAGCDGYLIKPMKKAALIETLAKYISAR